MTRPSAARGLAALPPHLRIALGAAAGLVLLFVAARLVWGLDAVQQFVARYPGTAGVAQPEGTPGWTAVLHTANLLVMVLIVRSGLAIRLTQRSAGRWTRRGRPLLSKKKPQAITLEQWFHVSVDIIWAVIGLVFVVLLVTTGRWVRLVPTSWEVVPNAVSVALQYLAFAAPHENGWVAYNALQMIGYFLIVFVLAPLALLTGIRLSALWPAHPTLARIYPIDRARALHYPVMVSFVVLVGVHVVLVLATGVLRNLNHMFALRDDTSVVGLVVALVVVALGAGAWFAFRPELLKPLGAVFGKVTR